MEDIKLAIVGLKHSDNLEEMILGNRLASKGVNYKHEGIIKAKKLGFKIGVRVDIKGVMKGTVVSYNESVGGIYCGIRYPVNIKRDDGKVFEYSNDQLILI